MTSNPAPPTLQAALLDFAKWRATHLTGDEKGEAQVFLDRLFQALGHQGVREAGATLEQRIKKADQKGTAFADLLWKPRCLIEMKKAGVDLKKHYRQAFDYWVHAVPDRPRYVVLCNFDEFWVYDFDRQLDEPVDRLAITELATRWEALAFMLPVESRPVFGNDLVSVTRDAAAKVAGVFNSLKDRGVPRERAQRFVLQCVMAMFSEDIGLLPAHFFTQALEDSIAGADAYDLLFGLFNEMNRPGDTPAGRYKGTPYFNGGLFSAVEPFGLRKSELEDLHTASRTNWSAVRPEIFGTLFERSMDKDERHAYGAHFTSQADIAQVVIPTIVTPWRDRISQARSIPDLERVLGDMLGFRVLDPACGSGNFLYVAYREMRRLEHEVVTAIAERRRSAPGNVQASLSYVTPDHFFGIDRNAFAVEIAKVTMMLGKKLAADELGDVQQVLPLDNLDSVITAADALFTTWPKANVIIGNPPYVARRDMVSELGAEYCHALAEKYPNVGGVSDYVTYWFPLAHDRLPSKGRAGFVATNTIRQNDSRRVSLDYIEDNGGTIFDAVSTKPWSGDAAVHVSIVNWAKDDNVEPKSLWLNDGQLRLPLAKIPTSLSPDVDVRTAAALPCNQSPALCFQGQTPGVTKGGYVFEGEVPSDLRDRASMQYIHPYLGGWKMLNQVAIDRWVIDLPFDDLMESESEAPRLLKYLRKSVLPKREAAAQKEFARNAPILEANPRARVNRHHAGFLARWWKLGFRREDMLEAIAGLSRYIGISRVATERRMTVFQFIDPSIRPGDSMSVFALEDDYSMGILSSSMHRTWIDARCSTFKGDPRYTSTTVWDSFPWPQNPGNSSVSQIAQVAAQIVELRASWLTKGLSLARQYNSLTEPGKNKLRDLHAQLDEAVVAAYGFSTEEDMLAQLFALNQDLALNPSVARGPGPRSGENAVFSTYRLTAG
ncbi:class I SAM-dependent DNA methyltransferase [Micromonospora chalcea]|uniref:class I SAM-dependent DNA methyltransferase n=1 Tax=Micromonospora chalcea TaxID=1874 RepID=UPI003322FD99